jgi:hypothetical protein
VVAPASASGTQAGARRCRGSRAVEAELGAVEQAVVVAVGIERVDEAVAVGVGAERGLGAVGTPSSSLSASRGSVPSLVGQAVAVVVDEVAARLAAGRAGRAVAEGLLERVAGDDAGRRAGAQTHDAGVAFARAHLRITAREAAVDRIRPAPVERGGDGVGVERDAVVRRAAVHLEGRARVEAARQQVGELDGPRDVVIGRATEHGGREGHHRVAAAERVDDRGERHLGVVVGIVERAREVGERLDRVGVGDAVDGAAKLVGLQVLIGVDEARPAEGVERGHLLGERVLVDAHAEEEVHAVAGHVGHGVGRVAHEVARVLHVALGVDRAGARRGQPLGLGRERGRGGPRGRGHQGGRGDEEGGGAAEALLSEPRGGLESARGSHGHLASISLEPGDDPSVGWASAGRVVARRARDGASFLAEARRSGRDLSV